MHLIELDEKTLETCLSENKYVLVSVYENDCIISEMMGGVLAHVCKNVDDEIIIAMVKKEYLEKYLHERNEDTCLIPELLLFNNNKIIDRLPGFRRVSQIVDFVHQYV